MLTCIYVGSGWGGDIPSGGFTADNSGGDGGFTADGDGGLGGGEGGDDSCRK
jgi:hypothetical protein